LDYLKKHETSKPSAHAPAPAPEHARAHASAPARTKNKKPKPKKEKPAYTGTYVEKITPSVAFIRRYCHLHGKTLLEAKDSAIRLLASLQKAIVEKQIRKTDPHADDILKIQDNLIRLSEVRKSADTINIKDIDRLREISKAERVSDSVAFLKQFLSIQGKENVKEKAVKLQAYAKTHKFEKSDSNGTIKAIEKSLSDYISGKTPTPEVSAQTLQGFYGLAGIDVPAPKAGSAISAAQFVGSSFQTLPFTGKWKKAIGLPAKNFKIMIYGKAGSGKSTFALQLADYLAKDMGQKVLYVAGEEKFGYTLHEKIVRLNISSSNLYLQDSLPPYLTNYDVVVLDSVNTLQLEPEDLEKLPKDKAYIWIFQCTKDGNYRGSQAFEHNADTVIEIDNMKSILHKNRFGGEAGK
jgi:hypothetical protein